MNRKQSDSRRFNFCTRCLNPFSSGNPATEHHIEGRRNNPSSVVYICEDCKQYVHDNIMYKPIPDENSLIRWKQNLLISSSSLRWVIENHMLIIDGFIHNNKNGISFNPDPQPPFGAIGRSKKKYYYIPKGFRDSNIEEFPNNKVTDDEVGGVIDCWIIFKGKDKNILNTFIDIHQKHVPLPTDLALLRQN